MRAGDPLCEGLVDISVYFSHSKDDEEVVLLSHAVDVRDAGIVQHLAVSVVT